MYNRNKFRGEVMALWDYAVKVEWETDRDTVQRRSKERERKRDREITPEELTQKNRWSSLWSGRRLNSKHKRASERVNEWARAQGREEERKEEEEKKRRKSNIARVQQREGEGRLKLVRLWMIGKTWLQFINMQQFRMDHLIECKNLSLTV